MPMDSYLSEPQPDAQRPMLLGSWGAPDLEVPKSFKGSSSRGLSAAELPEPEVQREVQRELLAPRAEPASDDAEQSQAEAEAPGRRGSGLRQTLARTLRACVPERTVLRERATQRAGPVCAVGLGVSGPFLWVTPESLRMWMLLLALCLCLFFMLCPGCPISPVASVRSHGQGSAMAGKLPRVELELGEGGQQLDLEAAACLVCLADFASGDDLMVLPCFHRYHVGCIGKWLQGHGACPSCRCDVDELVKGQL